MAGLTTFQINNAKAGRHADGRGLYLLVNPTGGKSWVLRVQVDGKRHDYGLGSFDLVGLAQAREKAAQWRQLAKAGFDPSLEAKRQKGRQTTFKVAAEQYHKERSSSWKNGKHRDQWINTLRTYAYPTIGDLSVDQIDADEIRRVLAPIWQEKAETARRVKERIGSVLDYSKAKGWRATEAPMRAVNTLLRGIKQPKGKNFEAMPYKAIPTFIEGLNQSGQSVTHLALIYLIMTAARSGEVRNARWGEIDFENAIWNVPAERMKMGVAHSVPLPPRAVNVLRLAQNHSDGKKESVIFPGLRNKPLSDMTLTKVLRTNGGGTATVHGFRSAFRDWCAESGFSNDWAEAALAHAVTNRVEAAYRRTKFLDQRVNLMKTWSNFCFSEDSD